MKFSLALVLVSLSVLTAAKHQFVRQSKVNLPQQYGNGGPSSVAPSPSNGGNPAKSQPEATPINSVPKTGSTSGNSPSGWVQNPSGNASFTARSGCQSPCKSCAHSHVTPWNLLSTTFSYSVRPESEWVLCCGQRARIRCQQWHWRRLWTLLQGNANLRPIHALFHGTVWGQHRRQGQ